MSKQAPTPSSETAQAIEHAAPTTVPPFTGWHYFLAHALQKVRSDGLDVHCFVKLGSLPLEADVILLHLHKDADLALFSRYFGFLVPSLRPYLLLEYKGPDDRLTLEDFDTVRAYAMLCKRKYGLVHDEHVAVALLYSRAEPAFFATCAKNGYVFVEQAMERLEQRLGAPVQRPLLFSFAGADKGEFVFTVPGRAPTLPDAEALSDRDKNPYRGLEPYRTEHRNLFFGRQTATAALTARVLAQPLTVLVGASGSG